MFRFTIRELVLVTVIVAMAGIWFFDHRALNTTYRNWGGLEIERNKLLLENAALRERVAVEHENYRAAIRGDNN